MRTPSAQMGSLLTRSISNKAMLANAMNPQETLRVGDRDIVISGKLLRMARIDGDGYRFLDEPQQVLNGLRNCASHIDLFTFTQRVADTSPRYEYPMELDNWAVLEIASYEEWWTKQINNKTRNMIRRSEKSGVVVREMRFDDTVACGIWEIYNESPIRQGRKFFNYGKTLATVAREASTFLDCSVYIGAFLEDKLIGFTKLTIDETGTQAGIMHIIALLQHRDKAVTNALLARTVRACAARRIQHLVYSHFAYGNKSRDTLSDFKEHNGFRRVDVPRYYIPLSIVGHVARRLGLHLSLHHHVPEPIISTFRRWRAAWYKRKYNASGRPIAGSTTALGA